MTMPAIGLQELRAKIGHRAKSAPTHRFWGLYVHLVKLDTLEAAYLEAKRNGGAPGSDGETFEAIEGRGRREFLTGLSEELRAGTYRPKPYRRREIPKEGGKVRVISIPAIRDRLLGQLLRGASGTLGASGDRGGAQRAEPAPSPGRRCRPVPLLR
jgi:RNA-directed DNA polymerase